MTVKELITELQNHSSDAIVHVWDAYHDERSTEVHVSEVEEGVEISTIDWK